MLGLTFTLACEPSDTESRTAFDAALRTAGAGDRRIRLAALGAAPSGNLRCTVHFSELGLLDGFVARLSDALRQYDPGLIAIEPAVPLERAA